MLEYDSRKFHEQGCGTCPQILTCPKENQNLSGLYPVIYSEKRYDATKDIVNIIDNEALQSLNIQCTPPPIDQLFWYKSYLYEVLNAYSREKEWRLMARCMNQKERDYSNIPDLGCLKAVYYGLDMEKRYKDFLMEVVKAKKCCNMMLL